jgi:hypothetical protein
MKIEGASRRSAAPGSQFVGVAEYGDDLSPFRRRQVLGRKPEFTAHTVTCASPSIPGPFLGPATRGYALSRGRSHAQRLPRSWLRPSVKQRILARSHPASPRVVVCALLAPTPYCLNTSRVVLCPKLCCLTHRMPPPSETAANPSFNLTHSGLRPPRAT